MWEDLRDYKIIEGDCIQKMREMPSCSIDAIVTDPPYGIGFMGKSWDCSVPGLEWAQECLRVLKPGGHMIAFSSTRTCHRLGVAIEDAGFEIRDTIHWVYTSGFPKNHDISKAIDREAGTEREVIGYDEEGAKRLGKIPSVGAVPFSQKENMKKKLIESGFEGIPITAPATEEAQEWDGYGTALKPSVEPAILARKPLEAGLTIAQNVLKYGTGAINIDACRYAYGDPCWVGNTDYESAIGGKTIRAKRKPFDSINDAHKTLIERPKPNALGRWPANLYHCPKPSRGEREAGLEHLKTRPAHSNMNTHNGTGERFDGGETPEVANFHPTVKPIKLMRWLCRLIGGKKGSVIMDTFCGSGTTGCAAILEGYEFVGIEITPDYLPIIRGRLDWAQEEYMRENAQLSLFEDAI